MRTIGVVTVARSDYGIYLPLLRGIEDDPDIGLHLIAGGMHLSPEFGLTVRDIERDGFEIRERVEMLVSSDSPEGVAKSLGLGVIGFSQAYARFQPDILLLLGDRFEMLSAAAAALPFAIPLAHIHGGESTEGLIDESIRHSITKMSHLHFVATEVYAQRVVQMGEEPWRVTVSGAPGLDNLRTVSLLTRADLERRFGLVLDPPVLLVTYHPVTLEYKQTEFQMQQLLTALDKVNATILFMYPNADTRSRLIIEMVKRFVADHPQARMVANLGTQGYLSLMNCGAAMVGNSSSGIIEAASFRLPVVNIGNRQRGRLHGRNVIDVGYATAEIVDGIEKATSKEFRESLAGLNNPYGDGSAAARIIQMLKCVSLDESLLVKRFHQL